MPATPGRRSDVGRRRTSPAVKRGGELAKLDRVFNDVAKKLGEDKIRQLEADSLRKVLSVSEICISCVRTAASDTLRRSGVVAAH